MLSTKFAYVEQNIKKMLNPLKSNQNFLRYSKYLSDYPMEQGTYDLNGNFESNQPDIVSNDLIADKIIIPTLFNSTIIVNSAVYLFFSPLVGKISDYQTALIENNYVFDIVTPFANYIIGGSGEFRPFRIADEICKEWDNQCIAGVGKVFMYDYTLAPVSDLYLGMRLFFRINDVAKEDL